MVKKVNDEKLLAYVDSLDERIERAEELAHKEAADFGQAHGWNDELVADMTHLLVEKDARFNVKALEQEAMFLKQFIEEVEEVAEPIQEATENQAPII